MRTHDCENEIMSNDYKGRARIARDDDNDMVDIKVSIEDSAFVNYANIPEDMKDQGSNDLYWPRG